MELRPLFTIGIKDKTFVKEPAESGLFTWFDLYTNYLHMFHEITVIATDFYNSGITLRLLATC